MVRAIKWMPKRELTHPCADISYFWESRKDAEFKVIMHFSRIVNGLKNDLEINFGIPMAVSWEDESYGLIEVPGGIPTTENGSKLSHPTLIIEESEWARKYADRKYSSSDPEARDVVHYLLVSLNDILHVLSEIKPVTKWVTPMDCSASVQMKPAA